MLKIREEQMEELAKVSLKKFEDRMVEHVKEFFPRHYEVMGEPTIRNVIQYGVDRAKTYDFISERNVCLYTNLMLLLGGNFDADSQLPWVAAVLTDESIAEPNARIDKLLEVATEYLDEVAGLGDKHLELALLNFGEIPVQDFSESATGEADRNTADLLEGVWPQKYAKLGEGIVTRLGQSAMESAGRYGITGDRGVAIYVAHMFLWGSGFDRDPQFPGAAAVLADESIVNQSEKVDRLYKESMAFLETWLAR